MLTKGPSTCPFCRSTSLLQGILRGEFVHFECADCGLIFVANPPAPEEIDRLYESENGYSIPVVEHVESFERIIDEVLRVRPVVKTMLDVGCGSGNFLAMVPQKIKKSGVDISDSLVSTASSRNLGEIRKGNLAEVNFQAGSFDWIHMGDVIEHVANPRELLGDVMRVLHPQGTLTISTPNIGSLYSRMTLGLSRLPWFEPATLSPPYHLANFSTRTLEFLAQEFGFRIISCWSEPSEFHYEWKSALGFKTNRKLGVKKTLRIALVWTVYKVIHLLVRVLGIVNPRGVHLHAHYVLARI